MKKEHFNSDINDDEDEDEESLIQKEWDYYEWVQEQIYDKDWEQQDWGLNFDMDDFNDPYW